MKKYKVLRNKDIMGLGPSIVFYDQVICMTTDICRGVVTFVVGNSDIYVFIYLFNLQDGDSIHTYQIRLHIKNIHM